MDKALELVEQLAAKLGVAAEYLMTVLIKQHYAEGVTNLIMAAINLLLIGAILVVVPRLTRTMHSSYQAAADDRRKNGTGYDGSYHVSSYSEDFYAIMCWVIPVFAFVIGLALLITSVIILKTGIQQLINPEYFAFKEILDTISAN